MPTSAPARPGGPELEAEVRHLWERRSRILAARQTEAPRPWYRIERPRNAADDDEAEIYIYDAIGGWFGISAADFVGELRSLDAEKITLHLNSPGGDAWDGIAIYTALKDKRAEITVKVDSLAASAASVIAMAGDRVVMSPHSTLMIHQAWGLVIGNSGDMLKEAEVLTKLDSSIAGIYADKAGGKVDDWLDAMREETWYSDQEAVDAGLADEIGSADTKAQAYRTGIAFDLSVFKHPPQAVAPAAPPAATPAPDPRFSQLRELEAALAAEG